MGGTKSTLIKRTAEKLFEKDSGTYTIDFDRNKKMLGNTMPSKKIRNKIAGYIQRLKKREIKERLRYGTINTKSGETA